MSDSASRIELLKRQAKKHQIFKERLPEASKMAEAGLLIIQEAQASSGEDQKELLVEAAACLSRAKRLCREVSRTKSSPSD